MTFDRHGAVKTLLVNSGTAQASNMRTDINYIKHLILNNRHSYSDEAIIAILAIADLNEDMRERLALFELSGRNVAKIWFKDMRLGFSTGLLPMFYGAKSKKSLGRLIRMLRDKMSMLWA